MAESDAIYWTFSSLFQGLCALYGLLLVWYVYTMSKSREESERLDKEYGKAWGDLYTFREPHIRWLSDGSGGRTEDSRLEFNKERKDSLVRMASVLLWVRKVEKREKAVLYLLGIVSVMFMMVGSVLISGLTLGEETVLLWWGTILGWSLVVFVSCVFEGLSIFRLVGVEESEGLRLPRTSVKNLVKRGHWFFDKGVSLRGEIDYVVKLRKDLGEGSFVDVRTEHFKSIDIKRLKDEWEDMKKFWHGW